MDIIGIIWNYMTIIFTGDYKGHSTLQEDDSVWDAAYELRGLVDFVTTGAWTDFALVTGLGI